MELKIDSAADQAILSALRGGSGREAAHLMVRYYGDAVFNLCAEQVPDLETAEDLAQESFTRAFASLTAFRGETSAKHWLIGVARACCLDHLRAQAVAGEEQRPAIHATENQSGSAVGQRKLGESLRRRLEALASAL